MNPMKENMKEKMSVCDPKKIERVEFEDISKKEVEN